LDAYRIKAVHEARDVRKVLLQTRKPLALEQFLVVARARPFGKLSDVVAEMQFPAGEERRERCVRDREVVPNRELRRRREQVLELGDGRDERSGYLSAVDERDHGRA